MSEVADVFTKDEWEMLIKYIYIGHFISTVHQENYNQNDQNLLDKIYDNALLVNGIDDFGMTKRKDVVLKDEIRTMCETIVHEFVEQEFWDMLIEKMANRDLENRLGKFFIEEMDNKDYFMEIEKEKMKYQDEIEKNGIKNIKYYG
jgi:hypothetical protein